MLTIANLCFGHKWWGLCLAALGAATSIWTLGLIWSDEPRAQAVVPGGVGLLVGWGLWVWELWAVLLNLRSARSLTHGKSATKFEARSSPTVARAISHLNGTHHRPSASPEAIPLPSSRA